MKKLEECKPYFEDVLFNVLDSGSSFEPENPEYARYDAMCVTLKVVYGDEFKSALPKWVRDGMAEYYGR